MKKLWIPFVILIAWLPFLVAAWDNDLPADNSTWNNAAGEIRANWDALEVAFGVDLADAVVGQTINVKNTAYGAEGDGATNDTSAVQAAIDAAGSTKAVFFPAGTYMVSGLTVGTVAHITGVNGNGSVVKLIAGSNAHVFNTSAATTVKLYFADLLIDGNGGNQTTAGNGIQLDGTTVLYTKLERVYIKDCYDYAIYIDNANIVSLEDCYFNDSRYGAYILDSEQVNFIGCDISNNTSYGLRYDTSQNRAASRIVDCWFESSGTTTPTDYIIINTHDIRVESCRFHLGDAGDNFGPSNSCINLLTGATYNTIINNTATGVARSSATSYILFDSGAHSNVSIHNRGGSSGITGRGTTDSDGRNFIYSMGTDGRTVAGKTNLARITLTNDATPSVAKGNYFGIGGTTTITDFDDATNGQEIMIETVVTVKITDNANIYLDGSVDWTMRSGDTLSLRSRNGIWQEISRSNNTSAVVEGIGTLADDATPNVYAGYNAWLTGGTTTITDFDAGYTGQIIKILGEHTVTITDGTHIILDGGADMSMTAGDTLMLIQKADTKWYQLSESDNN